MSNDSRTKNAARNLFFGTITRIYNLIVPFLMRTAMIYWLGMEYVGLNSLFTSILSVLNLAELGVGSAMTFSMYKPIAEQDTTRICALMRLYKIYYRIVGAVILVVGDYSGAAHVGEERPAAKCESVCAVFDQFADYGD